jgi:hypothetical protein
MRTMYNAHSCQLLRVTEPCKVTNSQLHTAHSACSCKHRTRYWSAWQGRVAQELALEKAHYGINKLMLVHMYSCNTGYWLQLPAIKTQLRTALYYTHAVLVPMHSSRAVVDHHQHLTCAVLHEGLALARASSCKHTAKALHLVL